MDDNFPLPKVRVRRPDQLIPNLLKRMGLEARFWEEELIKEWTVLVGEQVAQHTRPGGVESGTLVVFVRHPAWLSELSRYGQKQILANIQNRFGTDRIKRLRLQLDPDGPNKKGPNGVGTCGR